eukprot:SAG11_NODE_33604_length_276_cov_0.870056_2_plen_67_part_01
MTDDFSSMTLWQQPPESGSCGLQKSAESTSSGLRGVPRNILAHLEGSDAKNYVMQWEPQSPATVDGR